MIERGGLLVHLDPKGDWIGDADFEFTGWIVGSRPILAVSLLDSGSTRLPTCDRPDVRRVFPDRAVLGFAGTCPAAGIGSNGIRIAIQLENETLELDYPVPAALPEPPFLRGALSALEVAWWRLRERLARDPSARFAWVLRRHRVARRLRGGVFQRRHTDALLDDFATAVPEAVFLQIGANDGFTGDPLNRLIERGDTHWRGVLVEPVAHLFAQLSERYGKRTTLRLEQAAVGEHDGKAVIHRIATAPADSLWLDQIPSLDPQLLQRNAAQFGKARPAMVPEEVSCFTVRTLLKRHGLAQLDLLVIDTEGWDWRILRQFDLTHLRPMLILYEHQHLSAGERESANDFLSHHGYESVATEEGDTIAWHRY